MPDTTKHTPHESDILTVMNIDVDCDVVDTEENYPHKDYFQVRWSNHPHRIGPGLTKKMPRYLAEHYAKHLANHMLMKMEEATGRKGLVQSTLERPAMLKKIILGVDTWFLGEGEIVSKGEELQPGERVTDLGEVPSPMMGVLKPEPKPVVIKDIPEEPKADEIPTTTDLPPVETTTQTPTTEETTKTEETSLFDPSKPKPTRKSLFADCDRLGIEVTGKETVDQLIAKIKAF